MVRKFLVGTILLFLGGAGAYVLVVTTRPRLEASASIANPQCTEHGVAESRCPWCHPSLVETMGMCGGHQVPEAFCWKCTPALVTGFKAENDWCAEHDLPESRCSLCNPALVPREARPVAQTEISVRPIPAAEMPRFEREPAVICATNLLRIQFANTDIARQAGLGHTHVQRRQISNTVTATAEVAFDESRHAHLSSRAAGVVREMRVDLGDRVTPGQILAVIDSTDLATAKADYLQAQALVRLWQKNHAREERLSERGIGTQSDLLEAETHLVENSVALSRCTQRLRNLGLGKTEIEALTAEKGTSGLLPLTAPFAATVVERSAALGETVTQATALFAIADTKRMWAILDVHASDITKIAVGQPLVLDMEGLEDERHGGYITWVSSHLDRRTRTLKARAEILNSEGLLRDGMFGKAIVTIHDRENVLVVPKEAVQWEGCCNVVFVRRSDVLYEPRKVSLGYEGKDFLAVANGLTEGDVVVTTGSFLLKTEILRGSIGAGCCEPNPGAQ